MKPLLLIISGAPASGKTTLGLRLKKDLGFPVIAKDTIKEMLFDTILQYDRDWSTLEGRMAISMMYAGAAELLSNGYHVVIESSFHVESARKDIDKIVRSTNCQLFEIHCFVSQDERQKRYSMRAHTARHPGHLDDPSAILKVVSNDERVLPGKDTFSLDTGLSTYEFEKLYQKVVNILKQRCSEE